MDTLLGAQLLLMAGEPGQRSQLTTHLTAAGYAVKPTAMPSQALNWLADNPYDVLVLDLDGIQIDEVTFLQNASKLQPNLQIIILTSKPALRTAIAAIRIGAADYLIKPIEASVVVESVQRSLETLVGLKNQLARFIREGGKSGDPLANGVSNHFAPVTQSIIIVPPIRLDYVRRKATLFSDPDRVIDLSRGESTVLACLMSNPDQPLSTEDLARSAWNYELDSLEAGDLVRPYIHRLRRKLEQNPAAPRIILTVRGRGYLFVSDHNVFPGTTAQGNIRNE